MNLIKNKNNNYNEANSNIVVTIRIRIIVISHNNNIELGARGGSCSWDRHRPRRPAWLGAGARSSHDSCDLGRVLGF